MALKFEDDKGDFLKMNQFNTKNRCSSIFFIKTNCMNLAYCHHAFKFTSISVSGSHSPFIPCLAKTQVCSE